MQDTLRLLHSTVLSYSTVSALCLHVNKYYKLSYNQHGTARKRVKRRQVATFAFEKAAVMSAFISLALTLSTQAF